MTANSTPPPAGAIACSDASALPLLPSGKRLELLALGEQAAGVGGRLWNAAPKLCRWQLAQRELIEGSTVIELGTGTGACGLMAAGLGAEHVVLSDGGPPALLELCAYNVQQNRGARSADCVVEVRPYRWGEQSIGDALGASAVEAADWILASDVTYDDDLHEPLCRGLRDLLLASCDARAILCEEHGPPTPYGREESADLWRDEFLESFVVAAAQHGLAVEPFELHEDLSETVNEIRAFPMREFADADVYLMEVRLRDVRDVVSEEVVKGEAGATTTTSGKPAPFSMIRDRDSWSE